jgi:hypothetical protein
MQPSQLEPELVELESRLATLVPDAGGFDRDRLFFTAGRAAAESSRGGRWAWPTATAVMTVLAVVFSGLWMMNVPGGSSVPRRLPPANQETKPLAGKMVKPLSLLQGHAEQQRHEPVGSVDRSAHLLPSSYVVVRQRVIESGFDDSPRSRSESRGVSPKSESTNVPSVLRLRLRHENSDWNL